MGCGSCGSPVRNCLDSGIRSTHGGDAGVMLYTMYYPSPLGGKNKI